MKFAREWVVSQFDSILFTFTYVPMYLQAGTRTHKRFVAAEREVPGELLKRLDVDVASVEIGGRRTIGCFAAPRPIRRRWAR